MLQITGLKKIYDKKEILTNVQYIFNKGQIYSVLGGKNSGRTVLCECIAGQCFIDEGSVNITEGRDVALAPKYSLFPNFLTVHKYMEIIASAKDAEDCLKQVGIDASEWYQLIRDCEFITRKRLQLATFLVQKPYVMVFDDPFDYCDEEYVDQFLGVLNTLKDDHIILITTAQYDVARRISDDVVVLNNGELNLVSKESFEIPEIKQAVIELLGEGETDDEIL